MIMKNKKAGLGHQESKNAYGGNKHLVTEAESDQLKKTDYEIEQRGDNPTGLTKE